MDTCPHGVVTTRHCMWCLADETEGEAQQLLMLRAIRLQAEEETAHSLKYGPKQ